MTQEPQATRSVGLVSDTHGLLRPEVLRALAGVELIIHAGDVGGSEVLGGLRHVAPVRAVRGNMDPAELGLQRTELVELEGRLVYVLHDLARLDLDPAAAGFSVVVHGHSHCPSQEVRDGVLYLNPGSAGPRRFSLPITVARLRVPGDGALVVDFVTSRSSAEEQR